VSVSPDEKLFVFTVRHPTPVKMNAGIDPNREPDPGVSKVENAVVPRRPWVKRCSAAATPWQKRRYGIINFGLDHRFGHVVEGLCSNVFGNMAEDRIKHQFSHPDAIMRLFYSS